MAEPQAPHAGPINQFWENSWNRAHRYSSQM
jgi:hypothetical protein